MDIGVYSNGAYTEIYNIDAIDRDYFYETISNEYGALKLMIAIVVKSQSYNHKILNGYKVEEYERGKYLCKKYDTNVELFSNNQCMAIAITVANALLKGNYFDITFVYDDKEFKRRYYYEDLFEIDSARNKGLRLSDLFLFSFMVHIYMVALATKDELGVIDINLTYNPALHSISQIWCSGKISRLTMPYTFTDNIYVSKMFIDKIDKYDIKPITNGEPFCEEYEMGIINTGYTIENKELIVSTVVPLFEMKLPYSYMCNKNSFEKVEFIDIDGISFDIHVN